MSPLAVSDSFEYPSNESLPIRNILILSVQEGGGEGCLYLQMFDLKFNKYMYV